MAGALHLAGCAPGAPFVRLFAERSRALPDQGARDLLRRLAAARGGTLIVRVHSADIITNAQLNVIAYSYWPSAKEPNVEFAVGADDATITLDADAEAGQVKRAALESGFGPHIGISLAASKGVTAGSIEARISVGLLLYP